MHSKLSTVMCLGVGVLALALVEETGRAARAVAAAPLSREKLLFSTPLENAPGSRLTAVVVGYGPGEKSPAHHHAGSVFAYVLSGSIRSENSATGPARVYNSGETFFEPVGSVHRISENASPTQRASLLAIFIAPNGSQLTSAEQP
jgi:quercetin dioxygenase-like cupin family protein